MPVTLTLGRTFHPFARIAQMVAMYHCRRLKQRKARELELAIARLSDLSPHYLDDIGVVHPKRDEQLEATRMKPVGRT